MKHISWDVVMEVGQWLGWPIEKTRVLRSPKNQKKKDRKEKNDWKTRKLGARILHLRGTS